MNRKILFTSLAITCFVLSSCSNGEAHKVTFSSEHGTWQGEKFAYSNKNYEASFVPEQGYALNEETITVKINNERTYGTYTFNDNVLTIDKDYIIGDIEIKARPYLIPYTASIQIGNVRPMCDTPRYHEQFDVKLTANPGYRLPDAVDVYVNEKQLAAGTAYEYKPDENSLTIFSDYVEGDVLITGKGIKLAKLTFWGNGGEWDGKQNKEIMVDVGSTFGDAVKNLPVPKYRDNRETFDHWSSDYTDTPVDDDQIIKDGDQFYAMYVVSKFSVHVTDTYFKDDHYPDKVEYGKPVKIDFVIAEEDRNSRCLPNRVSVKCGTTDLDFTYIHDDFVGEIAIKEYQVVDDVQITMTTSTLAHISFSCGEGTWDHERSHRDDVEVVLATDRTYTLLEAWRFAKAELKVSNDPISEDNDKVFVGWVKDGDENITDFNSEISSTAHYTASYAKRTFQNDTWENVILAANAGLDFLTETYGITEQTAMLGTTRNLIIGDSTNGYSQQSVRLIGWDHDILSNTENDKAALTFEFVNTFYEMQFGTDRVYRDSQVRSALNDNLVNSIPDFKELEGKTPTIREVKKLTNVPNEGMGVTDDKCFLLSAFEMDINSREMPDGADVLEEGTPYQYYHNHPGAENRVKGKSPFVDTEHYWLRTPQEKGAIGNQNGYVVNEEGNVYTQFTYTDTVGVAPAFAIGLSDSSLHEGGVISTTNCTCTSHNDKFNVVDNEMGFVRDIVFKANDRYLFNDESDLSITVTGQSGPLEGQASIVSVDISDDHTILKCSISYTAVAADPNNTITLTASPSLQGHVGVIRLTNCSSAQGRTGFIVIDGQASSFTETFTTRQGKLFTGEINTDITYSVIAGGKVEIKDVEYSPDFTTLTATIAFDEIAATDNITIDVGASTQGYSGKVEFVGCTTEGTSFPIYRGVASTDELTFSATAAEGYYFNANRLSEALSYETDIQGGVVQFKNIKVNNGTITFGVNYDITASYGAIHIKVEAIPPYKLNLVAGTGVNPDKSELDSIDIIPGVPLTTSSEYTAVTYYSGSTGYFTFVNPYINNFKIESVGGVVNITFNSTSTKTIKFCVSYNAYAANGDITITITAQAR